VNPDRVIQTAEATIKEAIELIVASHTDIDPAEAQRFVLQQFEFMNADANEVVSAERIVQRYEAAIARRSAGDSRIRENLAGLIFRALGERSHHQSLQYYELQHAFQIATGQSLSKYAEDVVAVVNELQERKYIRWETPGRRMPLIFRGIEFDDWNGTMTSEKVDARSRPEAPNQDIAMGMKIFVSHSSVDAREAEALVTFIRAALNIGAKDIRCTSVHGYKLSAGADSNEQLRAEVFECEVFVALLSPSSMQSTYVMFELGARWGAKRFMVPVMIGGTTGSDLRAPLSAIHAVNGTSEADMHQLLEDLAGRLGLQLENPSVYLKALKAFAEFASTPAQNGDA